MRFAQPALVLLPLAALAAGGCASNPSAGQEQGQVSCWNVSSAQSPRKTYCLTEEQWARFLAAANVTCKDGPPLKGLCPEHWKDRERVQQRQHMSPYRETSLTGEIVIPQSQYVMPYHPMMPDGFVPMQPPGPQ
jgi:hypothetical protein